MFVVISPALGFVLGGLLMLSVSWLCRRTPPSRVDRWFRRLQLFSAGYYSLGHGANDAQKTIGIIWLLMISGGYLAADQDQAGRRFLRRNRRCHHTDFRFTCRHSGIHHAHHHRRHRRRRLFAETQGGALGSGRQYRLGLDSHHPLFGLHSRRRLVHRPSLSLKPCRLRPGAPVFDDKDGLGR
ncbi:MAG: inorganic phosphate transporter [Sulfuritalea sp.]|nr:inorganic phosphate transporter [Sulfuritalea sp.]